MKTHFVSTAIPYVNAPPHIGFALELIIADVLARHARSAGRDVYFLSGTDENGLKNALAAEEAGRPVAAFVADKAREFAALEAALDLSYDDFLRTSADSRHRPAVEQLWRACARNGDVYVGRYEGLYCIGCEQFYDEADLANGRCPEHDARPERVAERNYFFRLARYRDTLVDLIERGRIAIRPAAKRNEVLAFLRSPLRDLSISRSVERARGWGLPVPGDPAQVVYVWFDALANYVSALGYGSEPAAFTRYWQHGDRVSHVIGKGVTRFHAVYWPAILLSAGLEPPHEILVHGYVTRDGKKIGKSSGNGISPFEAAARFGVDALRYYLLRHVGSHRDGDFSWARLEAVYVHELANDLGNLVSRTVALGRQHGVPAARPSGLAAGLGARVACSLENFALHRALDAIWEVVTEANAFVNRTAPWRLAKAGERAALDDVLGELYAALGSVGEALGPFLPSTSRRLLAALASSQGEPLFPRISAAAGPGAVAAKAESVPS
jgi:methionyl-tRNA synthetase